MNAQGKNGLLLICCFPSWTDSWLELWEVLQCHSSFPSSGAYIDLFIQGHLSSSSTVGISAPQRDGSLLHPKGYKYATVCSILAQALV